MKKYFLYFFLAISFFQLNAQHDTATEALRNDLKRLLSINAGLGYTTFANPEGGRIESNATPAQIIEIVPPFLENNDPDAKRVCWSILGRAVLQKPNTLEQRRAIVEILCRHYLKNSDNDLQSVDNILILLHAEDFNGNAKKYIDRLFDKGPRFDYTATASVVAMAQVNERIPDLWKIARKDFASMSSSDAMVLASLARLGEIKAGELLCGFYQFKKNSPNPFGVGQKHYVTLSNILAFSLDRKLLDCLVADFLDFDFSIKDTGSDYWWWPASHLGGMIANMARDFPQSNKFTLDPYQLRDWLKQNPNPILAEK